jgi:hypothetical protein
MITNYGSIINQKNFMAWTFGNAYKKRIIAQKIRFIIESKKL